MPNKIPRACAMSVWTWTDVDHDLTQNIISFKDKSKINAQCLTTHASCSRSDYDEEMLDEIKPCDDSNIVKDESTPNHLIYAHYIRYLSDAHRLFYTIMQNDHKLPNFHPSRAFPGLDHAQNKDIVDNRYAQLFIFMMFTTIVVFGVYIFGFSIYSIKEKRVPKSVSVDDDEYQPLIKPGPRTTFGTAD
eukprot:TRINITY_DN40_c0_g1_i2.p1 TRINITY_DN40_c0_g1~~TRINITY_DN40_c0_g1_i2.p1  ORF type:complete len:189 (-),score=44.74 TRINITY_DN40_c0_g1_i2:357-923(-)